MTDPQKDIYEEYYGAKEPECGPEITPQLSDFHKRVLVLLGDKGNTSDKIADKLDVRENDVRRVLNELLMDKLVSYKKTIVRKKLAYIWKKRE